MQVLKSTWNDIEWSPIRYFLCCVVTGACKNTQHWTCSELRTGLASSVVIRNAKLLYFMVCSLKLEWETLSYSERGIVHYHANCAPQNVVLLYFSSPNLLCFVHGWVFLRQPWAIDLTWTLTGNNPRIKASRIYGKCEKAWQFNFDTVKAELP